MKCEIITGDIIKCFYNVYNTLGYGFLEKVYENALNLELNKLKYKVEKQKEINVFYEKEVVGKYYADLLIEDKVIVELKSVENLREEHRNQLINYLKATNIEIGLLFNFGNKPEIKRVIYSNKN